MGLRHGHHSIYRCRIALSPWWRHQMETFSALLAICAGNSRVNSPHKGQWRGALMFSSICAWINGWINNREVGDLRRNRAHYDVTVMLKQTQCSQRWWITITKVRLVKLWRPTGFFLYHPPNILEIYSFLWAQCWPACAKWILCIKPMLYWWRIPVLTSPKHSKMSCYVSTRLFCVVIWISIKSIKYSIVKPAEQMSYNWWIQ